MPEFADETEPLVSDHFQHAFEGFGFPSSAASTSSVVPGTVARIIVASIRAITALAFGSIS